MPCYDDRNDSSYLQAGFSLQEVIITLGEESLYNLSEKIDAVMETYKWIYKDEEPHDVMVKVLIKRKFRG